MKKIFVSLFAILFALSISLTAHAAEGVSLPVVKKLNEYTAIKGMIKVSPNRTQVLINAKDNTKANIFDLTTGDSLKSFTGVSDDLVVNDAQTYYAYTPSTSGAIVSKNGTTVESTEIVGEAKGFLDGSSILIAIGKYQNSTTNEIIAYDVAQKQLVFKKVIPEDIKDVVIGSDLAVVRGKSMNIYDQLGAEKKVLSFTDNLVSANYSDDGSTLAVSTKTEDVKLYSTTNYDSISRTFTGSKDAINIVVDASNKYIALADASDQFRIYDFATGARIYTALDDTKLSRNNQLALSKGGKYIVLNNTIYNGSKLNVYATSISLPSKYAKMELGQTYTADVSVKYANNTTGTVTKGVEWDSTNLEIASINNNVLKARKIGSFTLQANYLGFSVTKTVKVVDTKAPVFKGVKDITVYAYDGATKLQGITANDLGEGNVTSKIKVTGTFSANKAGKYKLTYTVKDTTGNTAKKTRTITVLDNPIKTMYYFQGNGILAPINLFTNTGELKNKPMAATFAYTSPKLKNTLVVQVPTSKKLTLKDLTIQANGKKLTIKVSKPTFIKSQKTEMVFKDLTTNERNWIKKNVNPNKKVKFTIHTKSKKFTKTLTKKQKQGFLDSVLAYDYVKSKS